MGKNKAKLGTILLNAQKINDSDLREAIAKQRVYKRKIGEILVMMGVINPEQLDLYLMVQQTMSELEPSDAGMDLSLLERMAQEKLLSASLHTPGKSRNH